MIEDAIRKEILARIKTLLPLTLAAIGQKKLEVKLYSQTTSRLLTRNALLYRNRLGKISRLVYISAF